MIGRERRVRAILKRASFVEGYNRAADLANQGRPEEAIPILEKILRDHPDHAHAERARAMLERLRQPESAEPVG